MNQHDLLSLDNLNNLDNLEILARQVVEGTIIGLHKSPFHGFSVEFAEHRLYNKGESIKNIDWKVYARTEKVFVKRFEEETNLRGNIIIDVSSSMYFPFTESEKSKLPNNKIRFSVLAAASLAYLLKRQRDAFGLSLYSNVVEEMTSMKTSMIHYRRVLALLDNVLNRQDINKTTSAAASLHEIAENTHKRSMVMIFSDMFENSSDPKDQEELFSALQHLKYNKHEVILFHVNDSKKEVEFEYDNRPHLFVDIETGEKVRLQPNAIREQYKESMKKFQHDLKLKCAHFGIDYVNADVNKDFSQVLIPYLVKRTKLY